MLHVLANPRAVSSGFPHGERPARILFVGDDATGRALEVVAVIVDQPQGEIYGGSVAAPAFGTIAEYALPYLGVPPE